jgi:hypothetical protein
MYMYMYMYICIYIYSHTHTHTHITRDEEATVTPERLMPTTSKRNLTMGPAAGSGAVGCSATTPVNVADFSRRAHCQRTNLVVLPKTAVLMSPEQRFS